MRLSYHAFRTAMWLAHNPHSTDVPAGACPPGQLDEVATELHDNGWTVSDKIKSLTDGRFTLARDKAALLRSDRNMRKYRNDTLALNILEWVAQNPDARKAVADLANTLHAEDYTGNFTRKDFLEMGKRLYDQGLIKGVSADGGQVIRAEITPAGEQVLDSGYAPNDYVSQGAASNVSYSNTIHGAVAGVQQGNHNTQHVTQQNLSPEAVQLLEQIKEQVPENNPEAQTLFAEIEAKAPEGKKATPIINSLGKGLATSVGGAAGNQIVALVSDLVAALPT